MRLLYVAMTRAKERLFITAAFKDPEARWKSWRMAVTSPWRRSCWPGAEPGRLADPRPLDGGAAASESICAARGGEEDAAEAAPPGPAGGGGRRAAGAGAPPGLPLSLPRGGEPALQGHGHGAEGPAEPDEDAQDLAPRAGRALPAAGFHPGGSAPHRHGEGHRHPSGAAVHGLCRSLQPRKRARGDRAPAAKAASSPTGRRRRWTPGRS